MIAHFYSKMIAKWQAVQERASKNGDYQAWAKADHELANYRHMLERVK